MIVRKIYGLSASPHATPISRNSFSRGNKIYELSNHLGNVLSTISDRKLQDPTANWAAQRGTYLPEVLSYSDYYPFLVLSAAEAGWEMSARSATELFLKDEGGNNLMLGVSGADGNPYTSLPEDNRKHMSSFTLKVGIDDKNNFKNVKFGNKSYSRDEWNNQFRKLNPQDADVRTKTNYKNGTLDSND